MTKFKAPKFTKEEEIIIYRSSIQAINIQIENLKAEIKECERKLKELEEK